MVASSARGFIVRGDTLLPPAWWTEIDTLERSAWESGSLPMEQVRATFFGSSLTDDYHSTAWEKVR